MRMLTPRIVVLLAVLSVATLQAQRRDVRGRIADSAGAPVARAAVELRKDGTVVRNVVTDADGEFGFDILNLSDGAYEVRVAVPGSTAAVVRLTDDPRRNTITVGGFTVEVQVMSLATAAPPPPPPPPPTDPTSNPNNHAVVPVFYATDRNRVTSLTARLRHGPGAVEAAPLGTDRCLSATRSPDGPARATDGLDFLARGPHQALHHREGAGADLRGFLSRRGRNGRPLGAKRGVRVHPRLQRLVRVGGLSHGADCLRPRIRWRADSLQLAFARYSDRVSGSMPTTASGPSTVSTGFSRTWRRSRAREWSTSSLTAEGTGRPSTR